LGPARYAVPGLAAAAVMAVLMKDDGFDVLKRTRNFFGTVQVHTAKDDIGYKRVLTHGTIVHGVQYLTPEKRKLRTTYYCQLSGVGQVLRRLPLEPSRVGVVGLGVGTLAAYGRAGDVFRFYEINPDVIDIARQDFSYLRDSAARVEIVPGDARLMLARERGKFDVLIVDAFSSDAIPAHLLTAEAADLYKRVLRPGGALLLHVSNRALDLVPVGRGVAERMKLPMMRLFQTKVTEEGCYSAHWLLISDNEGLKEIPVVKQAGARGDRPAILWTDDYSSLWPILR
jgi:SAM-dependent methyltransferase